MPIRLALTLILSSLFCPNLYAVETINLTTFYPAPTGNYQTLETTGNVGIGTVTPGGARLAVVGGNVGIGTSSPLGALVVMNGNVGIGERTPVQKMSVTDTLAVTNATGAQRILMGNRNGSGANNPLIMTATDGTLSIGHGTSWTGDGETAPGDFVNVVDLQTSAGGNIGIGTSSPKELIVTDDIVTVNGLLSINGDVYVNGISLVDGGFFPSDERLKKNIKPIGHALEKIERINGVTFEWKKDGKKEIGVIAQNLETVFPELVSSKKDGMKSVKYGNLVAVLIEAIREQQKQIDELRTEIKGIKENASPKKAH